MTCSSLGFFYLRWVMSNLLSNHYLTRSFHIVNSYWEKLLIKSKINFGSERLKFRLMKPTLFQFLIIRLNLPEISCFAW